MAVDEAGVRKDIFSILQMFGPQSTGGPSFNSNPGQGVQPPAGASVAQMAGAIDRQSPPPAVDSAQPQPQEMQPPRPVGTAILPPTTTVTPNADAVAAAAPIDNSVIGLRRRLGEMSAPDAPTAQPIAQIPGEADPALLPESVRNSPLFRYMQAQRAAQYAQAQQQANRENFAGGLQQIIGSAFRNQGAVNASMALGGQAKLPAALSLDDLRNLEGDASKAAAQVKYTALIERLKADNPKATASDIDAMAMDSKKVADYGFNRADAKAISDAALSNLTADQKDFKQMQDEARQRGVEPRFKSFEEYKSFTESSRSPNQQYQATGQLIKDFGERRQKLSESRASIRNAEEMQKAIDSGVYGDGSVFGNFKNAAAREIGGLLGFAPDKVVNQQTYEAALATEAGRLAKQWGSNPTDADAKRALQVAGGTLSATSPEAIQALIRLRAKSTIAEIGEHNTDVESMAGRAKNPDTAEGMRWTRYDVQPEERDRLLHVAGIPQASLDRLRSNPTPEERRLFEEHYGKYAEFALAGGSR